MHVAGFGHDASFPGPTTLPMWRRGLHREDGKPSRLFSEAFQHDVLYTDMKPGFVADPVSEHPQLNWRRWTGVPLSCPGVLTRRYFGADTPAESNNNHKHHLPRRRNRDHPRTPEWARWGSGASISYYCEVEVRARAVGGIDSPCPIGGGGTPG